MNGICESCGEDYFIEIGYVEPVCDDCFYQAREGDGW